jgi:hypothetical protein
MHPFSKMTGTDIEKEIKAILEIFSIGNEKHPNIISILAYGSFDLTNYWFIDMNYAISTWKIVSRGKDRSSWTGRGSTM